MHSFANHKNFISAYENKFNDIHSCVKLLIKEKFNIFVDQSEQNQIIERMFPAQSKHNFETDFDKVKSFTFYFPQNNVENIIQNLDEKLSKV